MKISVARLVAGVSLLTSAAAQTSAKFYLRSLSSYATYNNVPIGGVGSVNNILVAGLQPLQTYPVGGTITSGVLSFLDMDPSDPIPAYFIHGAVGSWIQLNVWGTPQAGYSIGSGNILTVTGNGRFYACPRTIATNPVIGVFYNVQGRSVPSGCHAIQLQAVYCDDATCE